MPRFVYCTASTLNGFLADQEHSLDWLFAVPGGDAPDMSDFMSGIGALVLGAHTYEWIVRHERLLERPSAWTDWYGQRPTFVFTSRDLPVPGGLDIRLVPGTVADALPAIRSAAGERDVWLVGGGDLVGQFDDAGALDELQVSVAPVTLDAGMPLLPRRIGSDRLHLQEVRRNGQFVELTYGVTR